MCCTSLVYVQSRIHGAEKRKCVCAAQVCALPEEHTVGQKIASTPRWWHWLATGDCLRLVQVLACCAWVRVVTGAQ